jgi:hypothetical protein
MGASDQQATEEGSQEMTDAPAEFPVETRIAMSINAVCEELARARMKFPPFASPHEGWAILWEEVDEMWDEIRANNRNKARYEAMQAAAMALRFLVDIPADISNPFITDFADLPVHSIHCRPGACVNTCEIGSVLP